MLAYILIETAIGAAANVAEQVRKMPGIQRADVVTGPYDIIAMVEGEPTEIGHIVIEQIHALAGVHHTLTCMVV